MATGDNNQVKSKRDSFMERMRGKYPDREFADDEEIFGQISDDYDGYDKELSGYKEREKAFSDMFTSDPRSAAMMMNWKNGGDPAVELVRQFGTEIKDAIDDPARQEEIAAANKEFVERVAKEKELEETYQNNLTQSLAMIGDLQKREGLSDETVDAAMELLMTIVKDGVVGKFSEESLRMAMKAMSHDEDVANAGHEGEVRGKNTKINETLRKRDKGDGLAPLNGKPTGGAQRQRPKSVFDLASEAS